MTCSALPKAVSHPSQTECAAPGAHSSSQRACLKGSPWARRLSSYCPHSFPVGTRVIWENSKYLSLLVFSWCTLSDEWNPNTRGEEQTYSLHPSHFLGSINSHSQKHPISMIPDRSSSTWLDICNRAWPYGSGEPRLFHEKVLSLWNSSVRLYHTYGWSFIPMLGDCLPGQSSQVEG